MKFDKLSLSPLAVIFVCVVNTDGLFFLFYFIFLFCVSEEVSSPEHSCIGLVKTESPQIYSTGLNLYFPGIWLDSKLSAETQPKMTAVDIFKVKE